MASFRVAEEVFVELMRLTGKTRLRCDGKIYKETRNLSLGDYVLSQVAVREMGLTEEDDDSPAIVDQLIARSRLWPVPLSSWQRGKGGNNLYFKLDRSAVLKRVLTDEKDRKDVVELPSPVDRTLLICDLRSPHHSALRLSELRCLYLCRMQKRLLGSGAAMVVRSPDGTSLADSDWARVRAGDEIVVETESPTFDGPETDHGALPAADVEALRLAGFAKAAVSNSGGDFRKLLYFAPASREEAVKRAEKIFADKFGDGINFEAVSVGLVSPDEPAAEAWSKKHRLVSAITEERLSSSSSSSSSTTAADVNLIALSSLKFDLLKKSVRSSVSTSGEDQQRCCDQKAGSFLQYNCARICSLLKQFDEMVERRVYPPLPDDDGLDVALLTDPQEWELVFKYVWTHGEMAAETRRPEHCHRLVQWLISLGLDFSSYYNRTHVLADPRPHLYPKMFARIRMLRKLKDILDFWLSDIFQLPLMTEI